MQLNVRKGTGRLPAGLSFLPEVPQEVGHCGRPKEFGRTERKTTNRPQLLLKLTCNASVEGQMPGIMRAGCQLVDHQAATPSEEKFDAQQTDHVELFKDGACDLDGLSCHCYVNLCRGY